jgi:twinkle protein
MAGGMRGKELWFHVGGTGIGKTSIGVELQKHLLDNNIKFGVMRFEDTRKKTQLDIMSRVTKRRLHMEKTSVEERIALHTKVFGSGLVEVFDPELASWKLDDVLGYLRFMNKALGCKVVFVDPLSFLIASTDIVDQVKAYDKVVYDMAQMVKKTGLSLHVMHHLSREQGKKWEEGDQISLQNIRGSAGIANFSMGVIAYERDQQGDRPDLTRVRLLKCRHTGATGEADTLKWDPEEGTLTPTSERIPSDDGGDSATPMGRVSAGDDY